MLAAKTVHSSLVSFESEESVSIAEILADDPPLRVASDQDAATVSPVHDMQSRLARELRRSRQRARWRLDPVKLLIVAVNLALWAGLIALGAYLIHHLAGK